MRFVTGRLNEWVNNIEKEGFPKKSLKGRAVFSGLLATTSESLQGRAHYPSRILCPVRNSTMLGVVLTDESCHSSLRLHRNAYNRRAFNSEVRRMYRY